ncbi:MAG: prepilin-type N-terminal cleavage/methylation domain-containing protein [Elusimicrobiaceae bacterium]|uniref:Prepilin-type N-terminal cleavage/methylation domain-containing protein n=1 Tax=Candidatus Avelusimicrobium gallicola TaxID=2562704 RepID=A0A928HIK9_9BACT|nr:prepilin-type N-terminal cleavage/methylation domain-containing protein [Elusimicrobium sp.]MBQ9970985.1 prepilin-type N-terminal cleavage/methylation domain-containing protein [Elusimicrobiaceae bacterium]
MKKGFTLMEMLAVVMVVAVIVSMSVPVFRTVRYEMKNSQAKAAAKKLAESMRSFYQSSRGRLVESACFNPTDTTGNQLILTQASDCNLDSATGIPNKNVTTAADLEQLFACGYLSFKDFASLPYHFCTCNPTLSPSGQSSFCSVSEFTSTVKPYVVAYGAGKAAGSKFNNNDKAVGGYHIYVDHNMRALDNLD